jgi:hypothetical protein
MIHARIISITNPSPLRSAYVEPISDGHSKYIVRKKYVTNVLLPNLVKAKCFESVEIFPAVTPDRFKMSNGYIAYENINLSQSCLSLFIVEKMYRIKQSNDDLRRRCIIPRS